MKSFTYTITDENGIHARPAGLLVKEAKKFDDSITVKKGEMEADAKKLLAVMNLGAKMGDTLIFEVDGDTEEEASFSLNSFVKENL